MSAQLSNPRQGRRQPPDCDVEYPRLSVANPKMVGRGKRQSKERSAGIESHSNIEILFRFDVIAIQEVKGDLRALRDTLISLVNVGIPHDRFEYRECRQ